MERLGVSSWTVREGFSALVHEGLLIRRPRKGTFVAEPVQRRGTSHDIGVIVFDFYMAINYEQSETMRGISEAARERGYNVHLFSVSERISELEDLNSHLNELILNQQNAGLIIASYIGEKALSIFQSAGIPFVTVDVDYPEVECVKVIPDDVEKVEMALKYLYDMGKRRIAILAGKRAPICSGGSRRADKIIDTYLTFMEKMGMVVDSRIVKAYSGESECEPEEMKRLANEIFSIDPPPDAIICQGRLSECIEAIESKGLRVSQDVMVAAHSASNHEDERIWINYFSFRNLGRMGMNLLANMIEGHSVPKTPVVLPISVYPPKSL